MTLTPHKLMIAVRGVGLAAGLAALAALTGPFRYSDLGLPFPDTVAHGLLFYALSVLMFGALPRSRMWDLVWALIALGAASEVVQAMVGREMSLHDLLGDAAGVAGAFLPTLMGQLRALVRSQPHTSFADLRTTDRRAARRAGANVLRPAAPGPLAAR
jgi:VanZ family protein